MQAPRVQGGNCLLNRGEELCDKVVLLDTAIGAASNDDLKATAPLTESEVGTKKRVTFTPDGPVSVPAKHKEITESDKKQIWYNRRDLKSIRAKARSLALRIQADRQKSDFEYSYADTMEKVFWKARDLSEEDELKLWAWFSQAHARRGLERLSASQVGRNRQAKAAIRKVLQTQEDLAKLEADGNTKANMLALVSQGETGQARALAEVFGKADMVAATLNQLEP